MSNCHVMWTIQFTSCSLSSSSIFAKVDKSVRKSLSRQLLLPVNQKEYGKMFSQSFQGAFPITLYKGILHLGHSLLPFCIKLVGCVFVTTAVFRFLNKIKSVSPIEWPSGSHLYQTEPDKTKSFGTAVLTFGTGDDSSCFINVQTIFRNP